MIPRAKLASPLTGDPGTGRTSPAPRRQKPRHHLQRTRRYFCPAVEKRNNIISHANRFSRTYDMELQKSEAKPKNEVSSMHLSKLIHQYSLGQSPRPCLRLAELSSKSDFFYLTSALFEAVFTLNPFSMVSEVGNDSQPSKWWGS